MRRAVFSVIWRFVLKVIHIVVDVEGRSRFAETVVQMEVKEFAPPAAPLRMSALHSASRWGMLMLPVGWDGRQHPAPARQLIVCLAGQFEITAGDGQSRRFGPGEMVLMEDTHGQGHITRVVGSHEVRCLCVQL